MTDEGEDPMARRRLFTAAWIGGLVTLGGVATPILAPVAPSALSDEFGLLSLVGLVIAFILLVFGVGWYIGIQQGHMSTGVAFIFVSTSFLAFTLREIQGLEKALLASTLAIGPLLVGWSLGRLRALGRQEATSPD